MSNTEKQLSPAARSLWSFALVENCRAHAELEEDQQNQEFTEWKKLLNKLRAYIGGELKSSSNLERFYMEFCEWEESFTPSDSLNGRITDLVFSATHAASNALFDDECDDSELIRKTVGELHEELTELGGDGTGLAEYFHNLDIEWTNLLRDIQQRPVAQSVIKEVCSTDVSVFGLSE